MKDQVLDVMKYGSGWVVVTTKSIFYTDGYSLQTLVDSFLDSDIRYLSSFEGEIVNNYMYFYVPYNSTAKQKDGFYRMDLKNGLIENWGTVDGSLYSSVTTKHIYYVPLQNFLVFCDGSKHMRVALDSSTTAKTFTYITNPVVKSSTKKVAKKINLPITISSTYYTTGSTEGFTIQAFISPITRQQNFLCQPASTSAEYNKIAFTTANYPTFQVGESLECLKGNSGTNSGLVRYITAVATVAGVTTVTLDTALPAYAHTNDNYEYTPFQYIGAYTVTSAQAVEMKPLMFTVKKDIIGKGFMIKFVVTSMTVPIEIMPFEFIYDDLGII